MPAMTKRVNVRATIAVRNTNPPIYGTYKNIIMTTGDILKCLTKRATVEEILPDGSTVKLNYKNYYLDNGAGLDAKADDRGIVSKKEAEAKKPATKAEREVKAEVPAEEKAPEMTFNEEPIPQTEEAAVEETAVEEKAEDVIADTTEEEVVTESETETTVEDKADDNAEVATEENVDATVEKTSNDTKKKSTSKKKK